jgi:hypothetical protein
MDLSSYRKRRLPLLLRRRRGLENGRRTEIEIENVKGSETERGKESVNERGIA